MTKPIEVDVWVRGDQHATTYKIDSVTPNADAWSDDDVKTLLTEMLRALERDKNPDGERPPVYLRGFSWIVSPYEQQGVLVHVEMQIGTATAGPFAIAEDKLTAMIHRVMKSAQLAPPTERVH